jgi:hypothetical protein
VEKRNLYNGPINCTDVAIRNAATFLDADDPRPVRISVGPTKKPGIGHAQAEAFVDGKWTPIINRNGFAVLEEAGDGLQTGIDYYLTFTEAVSRWSKRVEKAETRGSND